MIKWLTRFSLRALGALSMENKMFHVDISVVYKCFHHCFSCAVDDLGLFFMNFNKIRRGLTRLVQNFTRSTYAYFLNIGFCQLGTN